MVRAGPIVVGILVALFGWFLRPIADAMNSRTWQDFANTSVAGIWVGWLILGLGVLLIIIGLVAPGPYYYDRPYAEPGYTRGYRRERVVQREVPRERVAEPPLGERRVVDEGEREVIED